MIRFLFYAIPVVVVLYALIDAILTPGSEVRTLPKWLWILVVLVVPLLGAIAWLLAGRPQGVVVAGAAPGTRRGVPAAPDDDPAFLRTIDDATWSQRMRQRRERGSTPPPASPGPTDPHPAADGTTDAADH